MPCGMDCVLTGWWELCVTVTTRWRLSAQFAVPRLSGRRWCLRHTGVFCVRVTLAACHEYKMLW